MNKTPSDHHFVDGAGYRLQTQAARCIIRSRNTTVDGTTHADRDPIPEDGASGRPLTIPKRSFIFIQNRATQAPSVKTANIGGDGVSGTEGYPLAAGESIVLPSSPGARVFAVAGDIGNDPDVRTLELG